MVGFDLKKQLKVHERSLLRQLTVKNGETLQLNPLFSQLTIYRIRYTLEEVDMPRKTKTEPQEPSKPERKPLV